MRGGQPQRDENTRGRNLCDEATYNPGNWVPKRKKLKGSKRKTYRCTSNQHIPIYLYRTIYIYTTIPVCEMEGLSQARFFRKPDVCPVSEAKFRKPVLAGLRSNNEMNIFGFRRCWNINCVFTYTYTISTTSTTSMITVWVAYITKTSTRWRRHRKWEYQLRWIILASSNVL